jgi:hypothetical protein
LAEAHVSAGALPGGDGSPEKPFSTLEEALDYRFSLSDGSPCLASGKDGIDMGAPQVPAGDGAGPSRRVILTPGTYEVGTRTLSHHASIEGADAETTIIRGRLTGLRTGATLSDLTGTGGIGHALLVGPGQAPRIRDCDFVRSTGTGVICAEGSAPEFVRCRIAEILADGNGYGLECREGSSPRFEDGSVTNVSGPGVRCSGTASIGRTMIAGNAGSGVSVGSGAAELWSLVIAGNSGDGIECWGSSPRVSGTTIFGNWGVGISCHYDSYYSEPSDPVVTNSILRGNREASVTLDEGWPDGAHPTIAHSALEGEELWPGEGNTVEDPGFLDAGSFNWAFDSTAYRAISDAARVIGYVPDYIVRMPDLHLAAGSSALDTGSLVGAPGTDFEGSARPCGSGIDMGAYEGGSCLSVAFVRGDANADEVTNITDALYILEYLFRGGDELPCRKAADSNDDGKLDVTDPIISLGYLFLGGPAPGRPFEACGPDPTADTLSCASFAACP